MSRSHTLIAAVAATMVLLLAHVASAHKPLLAVEDNMDGTIYIEAGFSDGSSAAGHKILIKDQASGKVLSEHRVGEDGTLELQKPSVKYTVTLDAGEGHMVSQDGPAPAAGPAKADAAKSEGPATAPSPETKQTQSSAAQQKPGAPPAAPAPAAKVSVAMPGFSAPQAGISPGVVMAFKMMMITQVVTAVVLIVLVVIAAYYVGYRMGRNSAAMTRRKEV